MMQRALHGPFLVFLLSTPSEALLTPEAVQLRDLSGTWVATTDTPPTIRAAPAPVFGQQFALRLEGPTLTVVRRFRDMNLATTYAVDGSEVRIRVPGSLCMADSESVETAVREGDALVLTTVGTVTPGSAAVSKLNVKRVLRLETPDTLVVEGTMRDGAQAVPRAVGTVYRRSPEPMPAANFRQVTPKTAATIAQVAWLSGVWTGTDHEERWTPPAGGSMLAVARSIRGGVMSSFEFLCIVERGGGLVYQAMPNGRSPATDFTLTRIDSNSATFENPAHDHPKMIRYTLLADGTLEAVVSGDPKQRVLTFTFKKQH